MKYRSGDYFFAVSKVLLSYLLGWNAMQVQLVSAAYENDALVASLSLSNAISSQYYSIEKLNR